MKILFARHADPDYSIDSLTATGFKEAEALGEYLAKKRIDKVYCSPLGRAKDTMKAYLKASNRSIEETTICPWLAEFQVRTPHGANDVTWDWLPEDLEQGGDDVYDIHKYIDSLPAFREKSEALKPYIKETIAAFDACLASHGYQRCGHHYVCTKSNDDTIIFFCHFGIESFLLSHLLNCAPMSIWEHACAVPSALTTVVTEERRQGQVNMRMLAFGETTHLTLKGLEPSFAGRFCERFEDETRHD